VWDWIFPALVTVPAWVRHRDSGPPRLFRRIYGSGLALLQGTSLRLGLASGTFGWWKSLTTIILGNKPRLRFSHRERWAARLRRWRRWRREPTSNQRRNRPVTRAAPRNGKARDDGTWPGDRDPAQESGIFRVIRA
jgi:hypothetical protein